MKVGAESRRMVLLDSQICVLRGRRGALRGVEKASAQRSGGLVRLKGIGDGDEEEVLAGAVWPLRW
jgi:hypothetical protein